MTSRWTLRRRLVLTLVGLLAAVAAVMGIGSTLALRASLVDQLDDRLVASGSRSLDAQDRAGRETGTPRGGRGPREGRPPDLAAPGQGAGTISASFDDDGAADAAELYDQRGDYQALTPAQVDALREVAPDGEPHTVDLDDLGAYRVVASTAPNGARVVTGLSTAEATTTVQRYLVAEGLVLVAGLGIAGVVGGALVRRELARGDAARSPGSGSTGLGLAIVDAVVRAHGGRVAVDGTPGATTFTVTLPAGAGA